VLSGERNFLFAFGVEREAEQLVSGLGSVYEVLNANIKKWSVGSPIQAALDSTEVLQRDRGLRPEQIRHLRVEVQDHEAAIVNNRTMPDICLQHLVAVLLADGHLTFASAHDVRRMADPRIRALRRRIELVGSAALTRAGGRQAIVTAELHDGTRLRHHTKAVKGTPADPMTRAELEDKYLDLAAPVLTRRRAAALAARLWQLETVSDVRTLRSLLQPPAPAGPGRRR
jgi:2-methylcitrate dehydratase PrpD